MKEFRVNKRVWQNRKQTPRLPIVVIRKPENSRGVLPENTSTIAFQKRTLCPAVEPTERFLGTSPAVRDLPHVITPDVLSRPAIEPEKHRNNYWLISILLVALIASMLLLDSPEKLMTALLNEHPGFLALAILCMVGYCLLESLTLYGLVRTNKLSITLRRSTVITMVGQLFNGITPFATGGQPIQTIYLKKCGIPVGKSSCILLAKFITYQMALMIFSLVLLILKYSFLSAQIPQLLWVVLLGYLVNFAVVVGLFLILLFPVKCVRCVNAMIALLAKCRLVKQPEVLRDKARSEVELFRMQSLVLKEKWQSLIGFFFVSVLQLTCYLSIPFFLCLSFHAHQLDYLSAIAATGFLLMVASSIPLPGGSGGAEASFYLLFSALMATSSIAAVLLVWRIITFYFPILIGLICMKVSRIKPPNKTPSNKQTG